MSDNTESGSGDRLVLPEAEARSLIFHGQGICPYAKCSYCALLRGGVSKQFDTKAFREFV